MTKYIDAEKLKSIIKEQIKERKKWMKDIDKSDRQDQLWSDLNGEDMSILQTINSLQQEQPEESIPNDLEEAAEKEYPCDKSWMTPDMLDLNAHKQVAFRKGAKWKESQADKLPSDLNGAAIDFADNARKELFAKDYAISSIADYDHGCIDGFIAGAKWQKEQTEKRWLEDRDGCFWDGVEEGKKAMKEQMLKEAVEGYVDKDHIVTVGTCYFYRSRNIELPPGLAVGDKVRIIVIPKEDEK